MLLFFFRNHIYGAVVYLFSSGNPKTSIGYLPDRTIGPIDR